MTDTLLAPPKRFYLPQLDGLRFIAFFLVFFHHFPSAAGYFAPKSAAHFLLDKLQQFGWAGVDVFLCLSSFLLTSLLIMEHRNTGRVSLKQFFIRRALRIWPLYYLILILCFTLFPALSFLSPALNTAAYSAFVKQHLFTFATFMGNFSYAYFRSSLTAPIAPLWTISLEEQFYVFWPILLFILLPRDKKWFFIALSGLVLLSIAVRFYILKNSIPYPTIWVFTLARLDPFALGAVISYIYLNPKIKPRPLLAVLAAVILTKLVVCSTGIMEQNAFWQLFAVDLAACLLIYATLYSYKVKKILSIKALAWLGKISFGLYIFHDMMIRTVLGYIQPHLFPNRMINDSLFNWFVFASIAFSMTVACAAVSYYGFERHFLKLKTRFTVIASRPA